MRGEGSAIFRPVTIRGAHARGRVRGAMLISALGCERLMFRGMRRLARPASVQDRHLSVVARVLTGIVEHEHASLPQVNLLHPLSRMRYFTEVERAYAVAIRRQGFSGQPGVWFVTARADLWIGSGKLWLQGRLPGRNCGYTTRIGWITRHASSLECDAWPFGSRRLSRQGLMTIRPDVTSRLRARRALTKWMAAPIASVDRSLHDHLARPGQRVVIAGIHREGGRCCGCFREALIGGC